MSHDGLNGASLIARIEDPVLAISPAVPEDARILSSYSSSAWSSLQR
jgi:hypothetical protein